MHLKGGRNWRYQEASANVLYTARGYKDAGCPKNNNKEAFDRFTAFCISTDALQLKLAPQIIFRLNTLWTLWYVGKRVDKQLKNTSACTVFMPKSIKHMIYDQKGAEMTHNKHTQHNFKWVIIGFIIDITLSWLWSFGRIICLFF